MFFCLGTTAFGGPAAHIAIMEDEVVRRRPVGPPGEIPRFIGGRRPDPRPDFDGDGDLHRLPVQRLGRSFVGRRLLYRSGHGDRHGICLGLRAVRKPSPNRLAALRGQTSGNRHHFASAMAVGAHRGKKAVPRGAGHNCFGLGFSGDQHTGSAFRRRLALGIAAGAYPGPLQRPEGAADYAAGSRGFFCAAYFASGLYSQSK